MLPDATLARYVWLAAKDIRARVRNHFLPLPRTPAAALNLLATHTLALLASKEIVHHYSHADTLLPLITDPTRIRFPDDFVWYFTQNQMAQAYQATRFFLQDLTPPLVNEDDHAT